MLLLPPVALRTTTASSCLFVEPDTDQKVHIPVLLLLPLLLPVTGVPVVTNWDA